MYFECCKCHNLVDDGCFSKRLCLDCLYVEEVANRSDDYYASLCDGVGGFYLYDPAIRNKPIQDDDFISDIEIPF